MHVSNAGPLTGRNADYLPQLRNRRTTCNYVGVSASQALNLNFSSDHVGKQILAKLASLETMSQNHDA